MRTQLNFTRVVLAALVGVAAVSNAQDTCEVARPLEGQRLLRRLSLDLRGRTPSPDELVSQAGQQEVPASAVDTMLASEDFVSVMRGYHEALLWPNLDSAEIDPGAHALTEYTFPSGRKVWFSFLRGVFARAVTQIYVPCKDEPAQFNPDGSPVMTALVQGSQTIAYQEGWVMVSPYWAPGTQVRVCALDAQRDAMAPLCDPATVQRTPFLAGFCQSIVQYAAAAGFDAAGQPTACDSAFGGFAQGCGCGENLRLCSTPTTGNQVRASMLEQMLRLTDDVVRRDAPYTDVLLEKKVQLNGPLAHYLRFQSKLNIDIFAEPDATSTVPQLGFTQGTTWVDVTRTGRHSGVLTLPAYLLKFQSNRSRAHRFYNAFECASFIPSGALPPPSDPCSKHEDLTKRCGCSSCHVKLEPMAAAWGRSAEYGLTPLDDARFPVRYEQACTTLTTVEQLYRCFRLYQLEAVGEELPFRFMLRPYVFRTPEEVVRLEAGPSALAREVIDSGGFARCTTRKVFTHFMHREPTLDEESKLLPQLARSFTDDGYRLKGLVKAVVTLPAYRRIP